MPEKAPVLIVLHQEHSTPGRVGRLLAERGHRLDIRRPRYGDPLPPSLSDHAGAAIFGGPMSANDPDDFIRQARRNGLGVDELVTMIWEVAAEDEGDGSPSTSAVRPGEEEGAA